MPLKLTAIKDREGRAELNIFGENQSTWNSFGNPNYAAAGGDPVLASGVETVRTVTLDSYCRERDIRHIDFLKVDVEGFEPEVFAGAAGLFKDKTIRYILFEMSAIPLAGAGRTPGDIVRALREQGADDIRLIEDDGSMLPLEKIEQNTFPLFANYLAVM